MKFRYAVAFSLVLHIAIFIIVLYVPAEGNYKNGIIYYVDLIQSPGGPGTGQAGLKNQESGKNGELTQATLVEETKKVKDLTVQNKAPQSKLRYPDKKSKKKKEKQGLISVVRKNKSAKENSQISVTRKQPNGSNVLKTGISSGSGQGNGPGIGNGTGTGGPGGTFPYAYYIETLRNKISSSWYSSLVAPGVRGRYTAGVYFRIYRNGGVDNIKLEQKSGVDSLDLSAIRAVKNASPFPPLPHDFPGRFLVVHFEFEWEK